jgi:hypothetical protein
MAATASALGRAYFCRDRRFSWPLLAISRGKVDAALGEVTARPAVPLSAVTLSASTTTGRRPGPRGSEGSHPFLLGMWPTLDLLVLTGLLTTVAARAASRRNFAKRWSASV